MGDGEPAGNSEEPVDFLYSFAKQQYGLNQNRSSGLQDSVRKVRPFYVSLNSEDKFGSVISAKVRL